MNEELIIKEFKKAVADLYGQRLDKIILYGSRARRDHREDSDFDFLVVLKDKEINRFEEIKRLSKVVFPISLSLNADITYKPSTEILLSQPGNVFYHFVRSEGRII